MEQRVRLRWRRNNHGGLLLSVVCVSLRMKGDLKMKGKVESRRMIDNKGFSLVELLIAVAIAAIVGGSVFGFMTVGAKTFGQTSTDVHLQNEAQLAFNQIQDLVIDTVVGLDYVYITGDDFGDDSNKVVTDAEIPVGVKGKKLIMYNNYGSGRDIYEIVWKADEQKLYYNEYKVDPSDPDKAVKGVKVVDESLMAEFVTGFAADLSLIETKRVARLEITYEKDGRPYTSSHNITLRNKIVSGNEIPEYVVSTNTIPVVKHIDDKTIYAEPGDDFQLNDADFPVKDSEGNILSGTSRFWKLDPSDTNYTDTVALGTEVSLDGRLKVSSSQKDPFNLLISTGDGTATATITVDIIRITDINGVTWEHEGTVGKGELANNAIPVKDDLIANEEFKLTVTGMTGTNLDKTSYIGNTINDPSDKRVIFIKSDGAELFDIKSQDGLVCHCKMKDFKRSDLTLYKNDGTIAGANDEPASYPKIGVTAVAVYSMGGRGFSAPNSSSVNLKKSEFDYDSESANPATIGASSCKNANRYYINRSTVKPVIYTWEGTSYIGASGSFDIVKSEGDYIRGRDKVVQFSYDGKRNDSMDILDPMVEGNINDYSVVVDISLEEVNYKQTAEGIEKTSSTIYPYCNLNELGGSSADWNLMLPRETSANSEFTYTIKFYLFRVQNLKEGSINDAENAYKKDMPRHETCTRQWDPNRRSGEIIYGQHKGINLSEEDLNKCDYYSNPLTITFERLKFSYKHDIAGNDPYFHIEGDNNEHSQQKVVFYPKPFNVQMPWDNPVTKTMRYTYTNQFVDVVNNMKFAYYKLVNDSWIPYDENDRFLSYMSDYSKLKQGNAGDGLFELSNYKVGEFDENTPKRLRVVPRYEYSVNNVKHVDVLFDSYVDVNLWDIVIPEVKNDRNEVIIHKEVTYFPLPSDHNFPGAVKRNVWTGVFSTNRNKNAPPVYYSITKVSNGDDSVTPPTYNLTLERIVGGNRYNTIATYKCNYNSISEEWEWARDQ